MEKDASPPSNTTTITTITTTTNTPNSSPIASHTPPPLSSSSSPTEPHQSNFTSNQNFAADFASMYHSIFPPKSSPLPTSLSLTPSTCSSSIDDFTSDAIATHHRLNQARLILQYQELNNHYDLCRARLLDLISEADSLRQENSDLRLANTELLKLLSSQANFHNLILSSSYPNRSLLQDLRRLSTEDEDSPTSVIDRTNRFDRRSSDRFSLPKSISVRSSGYSYTKPNLPAAATNTGPTPSRSSSRPRFPSQLTTESVQKRVYVPGKREDDLDEALELDVYNQGMFKTELCNKWQETGTCPYGDHCQFAHGITELRPVIRHPRYKTEVCRMVISGDTCPYGHRCHFRHSLTEQERLLGSRS